MKLEDVLLRGLAGSRPAAASVPAGTLYYSTDTAVLEQSNGAAWNSYSSTSAGINQLTGDVTAGPGSGSQAATVKVALRTRTIGITVDGGGSVLTTGSKGFRSFPVAGTIVAARILADAAGNLVFDVKKSTYAAFPVQASIVAAAPPTLSAAQKSEDTTLTGWTTAVAAGDVFGFEITGIPATITRATLELTILVS